ncbi:MAG: M23 family metallopeptidase [Treponema sp.]|nr:M23 family metallopeptidase [Candidatus Treponema merdequi]
MNRFFKNIILISFSISALSAASADCTHKVQKGETLYSIGKKYQITVSELRAANNLSEKDVLKVGQNLEIPSADIENAATLMSTQNSVKPQKKTEVYTVQKGDTLYGIAKKYEIKVAELYSLNGMKSGDVLKFGQKIKVPVIVKEGSVDLTGVDPRTYITKTTDPSLQWPVKNPSVTYVKGKISGVELSSSAKESVTNIRAGTVMFTGPYRGFGEVVFVQSKTGLVYAYTGLSSIKVKKGAQVAAGDILGKAGVDSMSKKDGIKFMVIQNGEYIDPAKAPRG